MVLAAATALAVFMCPPIHAAMIEVVRTGSAIPGSSGETFTNLSAASTSNGNVVFLADGSGASGVYAVLNGTLTKIADTNTAIPKGSGSFRDFSTAADGYTMPLAPAIEGTTVYFVGSGRNQSGIYVNKAGTSEVLADTRTIYPNSASCFSAFGPVSVSNGTVAFWGARSDGGNYGIHTISGAGVTRVTDRAQTPFPASDTRWTDFGSPSISGGNLAFWVTGNKDNTDYICARINGAMFAIARAGAAIPATGGDVYAKFGDPVIGADGVLFSATGAGGWAGLQLYANNQTRTVVDNHSLIPGTTRQFSEFLAYSMNESEIAFLATDGVTKGLYTSKAGELRTVLQVGDVLDDGKTVADLSMTSSALRDGWLVMTVAFDGGGSGIYMTHAPEPGAAGLLAVGGLLLGLRRRR